MLSLAHIALGVLLLYSSWQFSSNQTSYLYGVSKGVCGFSHYVPVGVCLEVLSLYSDFRGYFPFKSYDCVFISDKKIVTGRLNGCDLYEKNLVTSTI